MDKFEEYFRTTDRYQDFLCYGNDNWILRSVEGRYLSEEIQRLYEVWQHQQAKVEELQKRVDSIKQLIQDYLDEEKELELKEWEQSTIYGRIAIELEQALKGEG